MSLALLFFLGFVLDFARVSYDLVGGISLSAPARHLRLRRSRKTLNPNKKSCLQENKETYEGKTCHILLQTHTQKKQYTVGELTEENYSYSFLVVYCKL